MGDEIWKYSWLPLVVFLAVCVVVLISSLVQSNKKSWQQQLPPGPKGWPLLGSISHLCGKDRNSFLSRMVEKYGAIFTLSLGSRKVVVVNSHDIMRKILLDGHVLSERAPIESLDSYFQGRGIAGAKYSKDWQEIRRFTHDIFRKLGVGRRHFETSILSELDHMMSDIEKRCKNKEEFDPMTVFSNATANVIGSVVIGQRLNNNHAFEKMKSALHRCLRLFQYGGTSTFLPFMRYLPTLPGLKAFYTTMDTLINYHKTLINKRKSYAKECDQPTNIIDAYLKQICANEQSPSPFNEDSLAYVINDLFIAGTETSATVLTWAVLYLIIRPHIQEKVHKEIDSQVPGGQPVTIADKPKLPYTQAVILESLRYGSVAPAVMRATTQDTTIAGYNIPRGTFVMLNYYYTNFDPALWTDHNEFKPERFLDSEGQLVDRKELIPFSIGRRNCLGESLAKMEIFLFFTNLVKSYHFEPTEGAVLTSDEQPGLSRIPKSFKVRVIDRHSL
ncbi:cytochrome P450 2U1-like [Asterias amurensis]|uniref:cytochrome P450 2U1-like n=1 Tax=Asterias amurensis TaxID=7602 RepID=UPI003AB6D08C